MPSINKIITLVFISTVLPYSQISDAQLIPYNHAELSREYITDRKKYFQITDKNPHHRVLDFSDWMQTINYMEGTDPPSDQYPIKVYLEAHAVLPRPAFSYSSAAPIYGTGLLPAYYLFDALASAGLFNIQPVHLALIDGGPISTSTESLFNGHKFITDTGPIQSISHAEDMAKLLFSKNTINSEPKPSADQIGAIPRQLQLNDKFIKSFSFAATKPVLSSDGTIEYISTWKIPVKNAAGELFIAKLQDALPVIRIMSGQPIRLRKDRNGHCGWDKECLIDFTDKMISEYTLDNPNNLPPPDIFSLSHVRSVEKESLEHNINIEDPSSPRNTFNPTCGGAAYAELLTDIKALIITGSPNEENEFNINTYACTKTIAVSGHEPHKKDRPAFLAISDPFSLSAKEADGITPRSYPVNYTSMNFGRFKYVNIPNSGKSMIYTAGNSSTVPLVAGLAAMISALNPKHLANGATAIAALTVESFRKAYAKKNYADTNGDVNIKKPFRNIDITDIGYYASAALPIPNPPCMLLHHVLNAQDWDYPEADQYLENVIKVVGGTEEFDKFIQNNKCSPPTRFVQP